MDKRKQQTEQTKKRIADTARVLFAMKGYKSTSIGDIVQATGYSTGNIYYHFKNKEYLFLYLLEKWNQEWEEVWKSKDECYASAIDKLYNFVEYLAMDELNHPFMKASDEFLYSSEKSPEAEKRINELLEGNLHIARQVLQTGIDNNEFVITNVSDVAIILESLLFGLSLHCRKMEPKEALALYKLAIDVILYGFARRTS